MREAETAVLTIIDLLIDQPEIAFPNTERLLDMLRALQSAIVDAIEQEETEAA